MHIKFLTHGKGQAAKAVGYVTGSTDHRGILREEVKVLRGHPSMVAQVADSLTFTRGYTSGVIAWAPDDAPSDQEIEDVLDDFERLSFAGLDPDRAAWTAVLHRESGGGVHLHFLVARVDLATGKCLNIAPPGWQKAFDTLRDYHNISHGWARPEDPARARAVRQDGFKMLISGSALRAKFHVAPDPKVLIGEYLLQRITAGQIVDRPGILTALREAGLEINREGRDYISVKDPETDKKYRLKGGIYESEFAARRAVESSDRGGEDASRTPIPRNLDAARRKFEEAVRKRAEYNKRRFKERVAPSLEVAEECERRLGDGMEDRIETPLVGKSLSNPPDDLPVRALHHSDLVGDAGVVGRHPDEGNDLLRRQELSDHHLPGLDGLPVLPGGVDSLQTKKGVSHDDGDRDSIARLVQTLCRGLDAARREVSQTLERYQRSLGKIGDALSAIDRRARKIIEDRSTDPNQIMKEVALVHYAEFCGYQINRIESSEDFVVMQKDDDKILVARDDQGRDLYFSLVHSAERGSFPDFVRKKKALTLGEVRKRMREKKRLPSSSPPRLPSLSREWIDETVTAFRSLRPYSGSVLESRYGLRSETIKKFQDQIREDDRGNVCFFHRNNKGATGWEILEETQARFSEWGTHSFFVGKTGKRISRVVITESALEAMSYCQIRGKEGDCYLSLGGTISRRQLESLLAISQKFPSVVVASGDDARGRALSETIAGPSSHLRRETPQGGLTWNEEIQNEMGRRELESPSRFSP